MKEEVSCLWHTLDFEHRHARSWKVRNTHRVRAILNALRLTGTPKVSPAPPASKIPKPKPVAGKAPAGKAPAGKAAAKK